MEFGHHFQIERLNPPVKKGAGLREFRLWENGYPCQGGQWQYSEDSARRWARYVTESSYIRRIQWLEDQLRAREKEIHHLREAVA